MPLILKGIVLKHFISTFRYTRRLEPAKKMGVKKGIFAGIGSGVMWFIIYATYALAFWYGVSLIIMSRHEEKPAYTPAVLLIVRLLKFLLFWGPVPRLTNGTLLLSYRGPSIRLSVTGLIS